MGLTYGLMRLTYGLITGPAQGWSPPRSCAPWVTVAENWRT